MTKNERSLIFTVSKTLLDLLADRGWWTERNKIANVLNKELQRDFRALEQERDQLKDRVDELEEDKEFSKSLRTLAQELGIPDPAYVTLRRDHDEWYIFGWFSPPESLE